MCKSKGNLKSRDESYANRDDYRIGATEVAREYVQNEEI